jgi:hypothetical protein
MAKAKKTARRKVGGASVGQLVPRLLRSHGMAPAFLESTLIERVAWPEHIQLLDRTRVPTVSIAASIMARPNVPFDVFLAHKVGLVKLDSLEARARAGGGRLFLTPEVALDACDVADEHDLVILGEDAISRTIASNRLRLADRITSASAALALVVGVLLITIPEVATVAFA